MFIKITERNQWERESWDFYIPLEINKAESMNYLIKYIENYNPKAKDIYKKVKNEQLTEHMKRPQGGIFRIPFICCCAVSFYYWRFVDEINSFGETNYHKKITILRNPLSKRKILIAFNKMMNEDIDLLYKGEIKSMQLKSVRKG